MADVFNSCGPAWREHVHFAQPLVSSLLTDLQKLVAADSPIDVPTAHRLQALANSWTAIVRAAGAYLTLDWSGRIAVPSARRATPRLACMTHVNICALLSCGKQGRTAPCGTATTFAINNYLAVVSS